MPPQIVEWRQTAPGIWTPVPDDERTARKGPVRKIASLTSKQIPPTKLLARDKPEKTNKSSLLRLRLSVRK